jgi:hypothetical protein
MEIYGADIQGGSSMERGPWTGGSFLGVFQVLVLRNPKTLRKPKTQKES